MYVKENLIHFTHLSADLTHQQADIYLRWALHAREFVITIWTSFSAMGTVSDIMMEYIRLQSQLNNTGHITPIEEPEGITLLIESANYEQRNRVEEILAGEDSIPFSAPSLSLVPPIIIRIFHVDILTPISNPRLMREELRIWENYKAASNFIRLWVLYEYGGIFLDNFVQPTSHILHPGLPAPHGILFHTHNITPPILTNAIIASSQRNGKLRDLAQLTSQLYQHEYSSSETGRLRIRRLGKLRLAWHQYWKEREERYQEQDERKRQIALGEAANIQLVRPGSKGNVLILNYWIDEIEGLFDDADRLASEQDYSVIDFSAETREAHIREYEAQPYTAYQNYSFEHMTGYTFLMNDTFFIDPIKLPRRFLCFKPKNISTEPEEFEIM